jgi:hypothetical protein
MEPKTPPRIIAPSLRAVGGALESLAEMEARSIAEDGEELAGIVCGGKEEVVLLDSLNDSMLTTPDLTVDEMALVCPEGVLGTLWHTHGTGLRPFSEMDRYAAVDVVFGRGALGLCSLGVDGVQCHYPQFSVPIVANIPWGGLLEEKMDDLASKAFILDDLRCNRDLRCLGRRWSEGMHDFELGAFDAVNGAVGLSFSSLIGGGLVATSEGEMRCFVVESGDGFSSLNCFGGGEGR